MSASLDTPITTSKWEAAQRLRDWIHLHPEYSRCSAGSDTCPDWPLAYELAAVALGISPSPTAQPSPPVSGNPEPEGG